ncbi:uncharacterized protein LOC132666683 [Panthera onca]
MLDQQPKTNHRVRQQPQPAAGQATGRQLPPPSPPPPAPPRPRNPGSGIRSQVRPASHFVGVRQRGGGCTSDGLHAHEGALPRREGGQLPSGHRSSGERAMDLASSCPPSARKLSLSPSTVIPASGSTWRIASVGMLRCSSLQAMLDWIFSCQKRLKAGPVPPLAIFYESVERFIHIEVLKWPLRSNQSSFEVCSEHPTVTR